MSHQRTVKRVYNELLRDHIETCESQRLLKTRAFIRHYYGQASPDALAVIAHHYNILPLLRDTMKGLAKAVGAQMSNGISLLPFNRKKVVDGIMSYDCRLHEDEELGLVYPVESTTSGSYYFGDFIASMNSVKTHSDYTLMAYDAFEYVYAEHLKKSLGSFTELPDAKCYLFLGPKALTRDDIEPFTRMIFMILALIVDQPDNFDQFYEYYLDSLWDYHFEKTGCFLIENGLTSIDSFAEALRDDRLFEIYPILAQPAFGDVVKYFRNEDHSYLVSHQLMADQFSDALYLSFEEF